MTLNAKQIEFGDFQTPLELAAGAVKLLAAQGMRPVSIVEPTCGIGNFLYAALEAFPEARQATALEINANYLDRLARSVTTWRRGSLVDLRRADFFSFDWNGLITSLPEPVLVIGNPPWVTAAGLGALESNNLPAKSNFQKLSGLDAKTGKSNFDIAEWMLLRLLDAMNRRAAVLAMLVKTSVARRVLLHAWSTGHTIQRSAIYRFNAKRHFGVAAEACLLVCEIGSSQADPYCSVRQLDQPSREESLFGFQDGMLIADARAYRQRGHLQCSPGDRPLYRWRSGVKHDCAPIMELQRRGTDLINGIGEPVNIESECVYPLMKGSSVARGSDYDGRRWVVVPQISAGEDTQRLQRAAPHTWAYLCKHADRLDHRASSIYRQRPRFAIFGVGPYTFSPWKVATCALYKRLHFHPIGPYEGRPVVLDDTSYHLSCHSEEEARLIVDLLESGTAREFFQAFIFWDAKRPVTIDLLGRLDLRKLATEAGCEAQLLELRGQASDAEPWTGVAGGRLF